MACHHGRQVPAMARPVSHAAPPPIATVTSRNTPSDPSSDSSSGREKFMILRSMPAAFEIGRLHLRTIQKLAAAAGKRDGAIDHHIAAVGKFKRMERVLFH